MTNMERTYKYVGNQEVHVDKVGVIKPGETISTEIIINNPLFIEIKDKSNKGKDK